LRFAGAFKASFEPINISPRDAFLISHLQASKLTYCELTVDIFLIPFNCKY